MSSNYDQQSLTTTSKPKKLPGELLLEGVYTSESGKKFLFDAITGNPKIVIIAFLEDPGFGNLLSVTEDSFNKFKSEVLDKNVEWTGAERRIIEDRKVKFVYENIPGTWRRNDDKVNSIKGGKPKRNRLSSRRKPTKRRRSRRNLNRKTKKN